MKKTVLIILALSLVFAANCAAYEFKLKYATHTRENDEFARLVTQPLFANITRATDGQVKFEGHYVESLLKYSAMWDGLARGDADAGLVILSFFHDRAPLSSIMDLPTLPQHRAAGDHAEAMWRVYEKYPEMQAEYLSQGIRPLVFISTGPLYLFTNKPVAQLEDLRGVRLVTESPVTVKQFNFFDTAKIHKGFTHEIFTMAAGETAGCIAPAENYILWNLGQLVPYITVAPLSSTYITIAVAEKKWQTLPVEIREQIMDVCGKAASRRYSTAYADHFAKLLRSPSAGATFITLTPAERQRWIDLNQPLVEEWLEESRALGLGDLSRIIYNDLVTVNAAANTGE